MPNVRVQYAFTSVPSHVFWASLVWDVDHSPSVERQLEAIKIERLKREAERIGLGADKYLCDVRGICDDKSD